MQKWSYFAMGGMAGIIAILAFALFAQNGSRAYARQDGEISNYYGGMGDGSMSVIAVPGMSQQATQDCLWIVQKGPPIIPPPKEGTNVPRATGGDKLTLALYKIEQNGAQIKLAAVRDVSYDLGLVDYQGKGDVKVREIFKELKEELDKVKK